MVYGDLIGANLEEAFLGNVNLQDAVLSYANLDRACLDSTNLQEAFLSWSNLQRADLQNANLDDAWLTDTNLEGASLFGANPRQDSGLVSVDTLTGDLPVCNFPTRLSLGHGLI
jgi:uncharacterized protein YjbI with pentapeptide repeats